MSKNGFAVLLCFWIVMGLLTSAFTAHLTYGMTTAQLGIPAMIALCVIPFIGMFVSAKSDNPVFSLLGYFLICAPFGALVGPVVAQYTTASVFKVLLITGGMTGALGFLGAVIPDSLESWGGPLFGALLLLLLGTFLVPIGAFFGLPIQGALTVLDWIGVFIFGAYLIFDLNRAMRVTRTHDNAIDCAVGVYLDILNIGLRLLELFGVKK